MQTITIPRAIYRHFASNAAAHLDGKGDGTPCGAGWISKRKKCSQKGAQKLAASIKAGDKGAIARVQSGKKKAADRQVLKRAVAADKGKKARDIPGGIKEPKNLTDFERRVPTVKTPDLKNPDALSAILKVLPSQKPAKALFRIEGSRTLVEPYAGKNRIPGVRIYKPDTFEGRTLGYSETTLMPSGKRKTSTGSVNLLDRPNMMKEGKGKPLEDGMKSAEQEMKKAREEGGKRSPEYRAAWEKWSKLSSQKASEEQEKHSEDVKNRRKKWASKGEDTWAPGFTSKEEEAEMKKSNQLFAARMEHESSLRRQNESPGRKKKNKKRTDSLTTIRIPRRIYNRKP